MKIGYLNKYKSNKSAFFFILPSIILISAIVIYPLIYSVFISFYDYNVFDKVPPFVGLGNYKEIFSSKYFWQSIGRTMYFTVVSVFLELFFGF